MYAWAKSAYLTKLTLPCLPAPGLPWQAWLAWRARVQKITFNSCTGTVAQEVPARSERNEANKKKLEVAREN